MASLQTTSVNGSLTATEDITAYSDKRLKENIVAIDNALDKTLKLCGVYYNMIDDINKVKKIGVLAQDIQEVLPEVVVENNEGILSVDYGKITALLIEAIKELKLEIDQLKKG